LDSENIILVTSSDHFMEDLDRYNQAYDHAVEVAPKNAVVIFWLKPTKLEICYG